MNRQKEDVTEAELALLQSLWDDGPATIRQLVERVYEAGRHVGVRDGPEAARPAGGKGICHPRSPRVGARLRRGGRSRQLIGRRLRAVADALCGGSLSPLLTHLVEGHGLSQKERRELRALIEKLDRNRDPH